jgi:hypothetical protein
MGFGLWDGSKRLWLKGLIVENGVEVVGRMTV